MTTSDVFLADIFAENEMITLEKIKDNDRLDYIKLMNESLSSNIVSNVNMDDLWVQLNSHLSFVCSIRLKDSGSFCGYCEIKNINSVIPEIGIQILKEYQNKGIGTYSIRLLTDTYAQKNGTQEFCARVSPDNYKSQRMMEKLGAVPNGILPPFYMNEELADIIGAKMMSYIDNELKKVAEKFNVSPEKLISRVLNYRLLM